MLWAIFSSPFVPGPQSSRVWPLEETLEILQDKDLMDAPRKSEDDVGAGRLTSLDDLRRSSFVGCVFGRGSAFGPRPESPRETWRDDEIVASCSWGRQWAVGVR
jgi:hypothetical protein